MDNYKFNSFNWNYMKYFPVLTIIGLMIIVSLSSAEVLSDFPSTPDPMRVYLEDLIKISKEPLIFPYQEISINVSSTGRLTSEPSLQYLSMYNNIEYSSWWSKLLSKIGFSKIDQFRIETKCFERIFEQQKYNVTTEIQLDIFKVLEIEKLKHRIFALRIKPTSFTKEGIYLCSISVCSQESCKFPEVILDNYSIELENSTYYAKALFNISVNVTA